MSERRRKIGKKIRDERKRGRLIGCAAAELSSNQTELGQEGWDLDGLSSTSDRELWWESRPTSIEVNSPPPDWLDPSLQLNVPLVDVDKGLYISWNFPPQLTGWNFVGGDPFGESWKGIKCSGDAIQSN